MTYKVMVAMALALTACSHGQASKAPEPAAQEAIAETRGRCPTDLNETKVALSDKADEIRVIFVTGDPSQKEELHRRVTEVGNALADVHPAVNDEGEVVQRLPTPQPELRESAVTSTTPPQYGWELVINTPNEEVRQRVKADLEDEVQQWRKGECPILRDEPKVPRPTPPQTTSTSAGANQPEPGPDR